MAARILIADDEFDIRFMLEQLLTLEGFEVRTAKTGREVLDTLEQEDFDLLMLDLMMPDIDGFGVLKELPSEKLHDMKVIILSAKATEEDAARTKELIRQCYRFGCSRDDTHLIFVNLCNAPFFRVQSETKKAGLHDPVGSTTQHG